MPRAFVHGDFKVKNLRARAGPARAALLCFDWENAGRGVPAADLGSSVSPGLAADRSAVRAHWPGPEVPALERMVQVGQVLRYLAAVDWAAQRLPDDRAGEAMARLRTCASRQADLPALTGRGA